MRTRIIREVFLKDLREALRDRRSLMALFGIPLFLYPLMTIGFGSIGASAAKKQKATQYKIAVVGAAGTPRLLELINAPKSGWRFVVTSTPDQDLNQGRIDAEVIAPVDFEPNALVGKNAPLTIKVDRSRTSTPDVEGRMSDLLVNYEKRIIQGRLEVRHLDASLAAAVTHSTVDVAPPQRRLGLLLARILPTVLLLVGLMGALATAFVTTTSERESGSMESLLVTPARKSELLVGKTLFVFLAAVMTTVFNLFSMSMVLLRTASGIPHMGVVALNPVALLLTFIVMLPTLLFISALCIVIGLIARNQREAGAYSQAPVLLTFLPTFVMLTNPKTTPALLATPIVNTTMIIRDLLMGGTTAANFLMALGFSVLWAGLTLSVAARLFNSENLVNIDWEPALMFGLGRGARTRRPRLPAIDEALAIVGLSLLLTFYAAPSMVRLPLLPMTAFMEFVLIAGITLVAGVVLRYRWVETFSLRAPTLRQLAGAILIGFGVLPIVAGVNWVQQQFWPADENMLGAVRSLLAPALQRSPVLVPVAMGLMAGVCEELMFRGPLQVSLLRRLPVWAALLVGGVIFAAVHMDAHGMVFRTALGMLLGWTVIRTGSIVPAMLMHAVIDIGGIGFTSWRIATHGVDRAFSHGADIPDNWPVWLIAGVLAIAVGLWLLTRDAQRVAVPAVGHA